MRKICKLSLYVIFLIILVELAVRLFLYISLNNYLNQFVPDPYRTNIKRFCHISLSRRDRRLAFAHYKFDPLCYAFPRDGRFFRGVNGQVSYPEERQKDTEVRIICIGDSTTFGVAVDYHESWPYLLEKLLRDRYPRRKIKVLNAAIPSANPRHIKRVFQLHLAQHKPDIVLYKGKCVLSDTYQIKGPRFPLEYWVWRCLYSSRIFRVACILVDRNLNKTPDYCSMDAVFGFSLELQERYVV